MTAPVPDHAALPADELRRLLYGASVDQRYPEEAIGRAFCRAMEAAEDAAREVLEAMPLQQPVKIHADFWKYARKILGGYDCTIPTGTREGKRWCRHDREGLWIGEYGPNAAITWWKVVLE